MLPKRLPARTVRDSEADIECCLRGCQRVLPERLPASATSECCLRGYQRVLLERLPRVLHERQPASAAKKGYQRVLPASAIPERLPASAVRAATSECCLRGYVRVLPERLPASATSECCQRGCSECCDVYLPLQAVLARSRVRYMQAHEEGIVVVIF